MKKYFSLFTVLTAISIIIQAQEEFKYENMSYIRTSDSTAMLKKGYLEGAVIIPDTVIYNKQKLAVNEIGAGAFLVSYNPKLTSITIPKSVKIIRKQAFSGQSEITDIYINGSNIDFESSIFSKRASITRRVHINHFEDLCNNHYAVNITGSTGGSSPLNGSYIYIDGIEVDTIHLKNITTITDNAFEGVLNNLYLTCNELISIGNYAFFDSNLRHITLPSSLKFIGDAAFKYCYGITNITIPENLEHIGVYAFENVNNLTKITWKAKSLQVDNAPAYSAFYLSSDKLDTLVIDSGVLNIPQYMFYSSIYTATPVIISKNKNVPRAFKNSFYALNAKSPLYVPKGTKNDYNSNVGWNKFTYIHEFELEESTGIETIYSNTSTTNSKIIHNGKLLIIRDGRIYNVMGQEL